MKNIFAIVFIAAASVAVAQKQVVSAYNANKSGDYKAAAGYIEEAITIEKAALKDKTWRYRGEIYLNIANDSALEEHHWGVPTMVFQGEPFFGQDKIELLLWRMQQKGLERIG